MARKSERLSSSSISARAQPTHKRAASNTAPPKVEAKRSKTKKLTSQYFESEAPGSNDDVDRVEPEDATVSEQEDHSDFGDDAEESGPSDAEESDEYDSEDELKSRKKSTLRKSTSSSAAIRAGGEDVWRPDVKAGLGPGKQVIIKKPKARAAGKVPYSDETIHPNTLLFLQDLKANNDRQWLKSKSWSFCGAGVTLVFVFCTHGHDPAIFCAFTLIPGCHVDTSTARLLGVGCKAMRYVLRSLAPTG